MKKRGAYQKAKERSNKLRDIFAGFLAVLVTLIFVWGITEAAVTVSNIDNDTCRSYSGEHTCQLVTKYGKYRSTTYRFSLDNGDKLVVDYARVTDKEGMERLDTLRFQYSSFPRLLSGHYRVIALSSADGSTEFVNLQETRAICIEQIWGLSVILAVWLMLWTVVIVIAFLLRRKRRK
ncbi:MAG: hypothetical protein E7447_04300 [Ruminococcaceae bacterium]|nr:hypothetical protein [Oscillospiraceae bacterium]